jgi:glucosyl-3-phosphoglycerate phosphatase
VGREDVTRLVLVRHGETDWNVQRRWQGQTGTGLNALGRRQARATAAHLAATFPETALIARSDSLRVAETSHPLEEALAAPVVVDPRLRELDVGRWSGRTSAEVEVADPEGWAAYRRGEPVAIGGGETVAAVRERMLAAIDDVVVRAAGGTAVVLTHGWALRVAVLALVARAGGSAPAESELARASNCSVSVLELAGGRAELPRYACCRHLEDEALVSAPRHAAGRA